MVENDEMQNALKRIKKVYEIFSVEPCKGYQLGTRRYYRNAVAVLICRLYGWDLPEHRNVALLCYGRGGYYLIDPLQGYLRFQMDHRWFDRGFKDHSPDDEIVHEAIYIGMGGNPDIKITVDKNGNEKATVLPKH